MLFATEIGRGPISMIVGSICAAIGSMLVMKALLFPVMSKVPRSLRVVLDFLEVRGTTSRSARLVVGAFLIVFGIVFMLVG